MRLPTAVVEGVLRLTVAPLLHPRVPVGVQRALLDLGARALPVPSGTSVVAEPGGERVTAPGAAGRPLLLVHGGGFTTGSPTTHRSYAAHLSAAAGVPVVVLDYRRAPEHPHPAAVDDVLAALDRLGQGTSLVGDSAGGALCLLAVLRLRDQGRPLPPALGLVSPLVDLHHTRSRAYDGRDPYLGQAWLEAATTAYVGTAGRDAVSLLGRDLHGLPPTLVQVGTHERLRPEGEALAAAAAEQGVDVTLEVLPRLWHDAHLQAGLHAGAAAAVRDLGAWLRERSAA